MKKKLMILLVALLLLVPVACKKADDKSTDAPATDGATDTTESASGDEKLDFEGKTMNVVTTSDSYKELFDEFAKETNAKVEFLSMSSGEVISRIEAEGGKPMADLWFGGGIDAFMAAKDKGLLEAYVPKAKDTVDERFRDPEGYWNSKGLTVVGFLVNEKALQEKGLETPKTWDDLADPKYKGQVIMANPAISGTNYAAVKALLDTKGTEEGWDYLSKLNDNIEFYGKRGKDPEEKTVSGEFNIGIIPADKKSFDVAEENDLKVVYPEDGIPWVPEGVAIFKGGDGTEIAKAFIDFMLKPENQAKLAKLDGKDSSQMIVKDVEGFDLGLPEDKLMDIDISTFGSQREEILSKWEEMTKDK